tara:strand:+ start:1626 stop:2768 length:1143 start_codon:yes stop_codon:yes gene_type:complete
MKISKGIIILLVGFSISCKDKSSENRKILKQNKIAKSDIRIPEESLPETIFNYVLVHYPTAIVSISKLENNGNYELELDNELELIFDSKGNFLGIDDNQASSFGDSFIIPNSLPPNIKKRIHRYYPEKKIIKAELENNGHFEIVLSDDSTIVFDGNENFIGVGKELRYNGEMEFSTLNGETDTISSSQINPAMLPLVAMDYLVSNYDSYAIMSVNLEEDGDYEVTLDNGTEIYFNSLGIFLNSGNAYGSDTGDNLGGTIISINNLSQLIIDHINISYPEESITQARKRENNRIDIDLSNGIEIYFDANGSYLSTDENNNGDDHGTEVEFESLPQSVKDSLTPNNLSRLISKVQLEASGHYKIFYINKEAIYIDVNGNLIK